MIRSSPACFRVSAAPVKCGLPRSTVVFADLMFRLGFAGRRAEERTSSSCGTARIASCRIKPPGNVLAPLVRFRQADQFEKRP